MSYIVTHRTLLHIIIMCNLRFVKGGVVAKQSDDELVAVSVYMPKALHGRILGLSKQERRSISSQIVVMLEMVSGGDRPRRVHVEHSDKPLE